MEQQELTHSVKSVGICWKLISLFETDVAVDPERTNDWFLIHQVPSRGTMRAIWGFIHPATYLPRDVQSQLVRVCAQRPFLHLHVSRMYICVYIYIYIYLYIIYVCNITWSTYQCDTPQPPVAYGSVPIRFSFINPHFPYVYRLCTRAHEEHQIGMPPQQLRLSGESASESLSKEVFV
jgi:hypothetical protein